MHERKHLMQSLAQACVALPGGFGTLEEIFEALTWAQKPLEMHEKPCVFVNSRGYFDHLFWFLDHAEASGLLLTRNRAVAKEVDSAVAGLDLVQGMWAAEEAAMQEVIRAYQS